MNRCCLLAALSLGLSIAHQNRAQEYVWVPPPGTSVDQITVTPGSDVYTYLPNIVVGDPLGAPPITPAGRVSANVGAAFTAGVVSLFFDSGTPGDGLGSICTGTLISPNHILTNAHCVDLLGGVAPGGAPTVDGSVDVALATSSVFFNHTGDAAAVRGVAAIEVHPDWHGFNNTAGPEVASISDDLAIITLDAAAPAGVPVYPINTEPFRFVQPLVMAGYGNSGDGVGGFDTPASLTIKRAGQNTASFALADDEGVNPEPEMFLFDFDGPDASTDTLDGILTIGNNFETTIGPGDSGGPSFRWADDGDNIPEFEEMTLFGVNSFSRGGGPVPDAPFFGSQGGGLLVSTYEPWISSVVPEPSSALFLLAGSLLVGRRRRPELA